MRKMIFVICCILFVLVLSSCASTPNSTPALNNPETVADSKESDFTEAPDLICAPRIGMTKEQVRVSTWGQPKKINTTTTANGVTEQWVYSRGYIYFKNEVVTTIQERS